MIFFGRGVKVNVITLKHNGNNITFRCCAEPFPNASGTDMEDDERAEIAFDDLREVDSLISMLERFKEENCAHMGEWRRRG